MMTTLSVKQCKSPTFRVLPSCVGLFSFLSSKMSYSSSAESSSKGSLWRGATEG